MVKVKPQIVPHLWYDKEAKDQKREMKPFIETNEVLGGYWMIQVSSKEEAIEWARRCPASDNEVIEIRQVQEFADFPADAQKAAAKFPEMQKQSKQRKKQ